MSKFFISYWTECESDENDECRRNALKWFFAELDRKNVKALNAFILVTAMYFSVETKELDESSETKPDKHKKSDNKTERYYF